MLMHPVHPTSATQWPLPALPGVIPKRRKAAATCSYATRLDGLLSASSPPLLATPSLPEKLWWFRIRQTSTSTMGPAAETRALIIRATIELIQRIGVGALTTKSIAAEAGISEGTLFNHFAKKDDLIFTVIVESVPRFEPPDIAAGVGNIHENLSALVRAALRFYNGVVPIVLGLFADTSLLTRHISAVRNRYGGPQYMVEYFVVYVQAEQACGRIGDSVKATSVTSALLGACFQWVFVSRLSGEPLWAEMPEDEFVDGLLGMLTVGLRPRSIA